MWDRVPMGGIRRSMIHHGSPRRVIAKAMMELYDLGTEEFTNQRLGDMVNMTPQRIGQRISTEFRLFIRLERLKNVKGSGKTGWRFIRDK